MGGARKPDLDTTLGMDPGISPVHLSRRDFDAARARTAWRLGLVTSDHSSTPVGAGSRTGTIAPGRTTAAPSLDPTLAITTAKYGSSTAPTRGTKSHHPVTKKHAMTQATLSPMAMPYLTILRWRSSSGEEGSVVIDCGCFIGFRAILRHRSGASHTSLRRVCLTIGWGP